MFYRVFDILRSILRSNSGFLRQLWSYYARNPVEGQIGIFLGSSQVFFEKGAGFRPNLGVFGLVFSSDCRLRELRTVRVRKNRAELFYS